ncbi:DUF4389 domain-containing protein [Actinokineospora sp. HUAS TT18]|uniref:DUF4389 domain-containing protein n=1 Tax=Actinokineospora sp. HUAS TT18 TaxID=3447451 RepID=UPI003F522AD1
MTETTPVRVDADLDPALSRGLWLVKWLLLIPHYVVLALLWIAFPIVGLIAAVAILFTGRYPRPLFDFALGVLRWSWRVHYYGYAALGTDRYPPFTLDAVPDYPARLDIAYPERLSRGLVLVKWLLAIPHLILVGLFAGGGLWVLGGRSDDFQWAAGGLIGVLVLVAGVVLLFTGAYPRSIFDFVLGLDRWVLRVAAYVALMTDEYPPFRLDTGGTEPGQAPSPTHPAPPAPTRWTPGRVAGVVVGAVIALVAMGVLTGGGGLLWADRVHRGADGYVSTGTVTVAGAGHALTIGEISVRGTAISVSPVSDVVGTVRLRATSAQSVFIGIAPADAVDRYLAGVAVSEVGEFRDGALTTTEVRGGPPAVAPREAGIWTEWVSGTGTQTLTWQLWSGDWRIVVMNADASAGVTVTAAAAAELPGLLWIAVGLLVLGVLLLAAGIALIVGVGRPRPARTPVAHERSTT